LINDAALVEEEVGLDHERKTDKLAVLERDMSTSRAMESITLKEVPVVIMAPGHSGKNGRRKQSRQKLESLYPKVAFVQPRHEPLSRSSRPVSNSVTPSIPSIATNSAQPAQYRVLTLSREGAHSFAPSPVVPSVETSLDEDNTATTRQLIEEGPKRLRLRFFPSLEVSFDLPPDYPSDAPPEIKISDSSEWLTQSQLDVLEKKLGERKCDAYVKSMK
jgi:hypothetical protein